MIPLCPAIRSTLRDEAASLRARLARVEADLATIDSPDAALDEVYEVGYRAIPIAERQAVAANFAADANANHLAVRREVIAIGVAAAGGDR